LSIVEIDESGRFTIPKAMRAKAQKALMIPTGLSYLVVPIPGVALEQETKESTRTVKANAERKLKSEVKRRLARKLHALMAERARAAPSSTIA
jgi:DNA-binding transcriptional regulator/RsmH inhibitor MraZ